MSSPALSSSFSLPMSLSYATLSLYAVGQLSRKHLPFRVSILIPASRFPKRPVCKCFTALRPAASVNAANVRGPHSLTFPCPRLSHPDSFCWHFGPDNKTPCGAVATLFFNNAPIPMQHDLPICYRRPAWSHPDGCGSGGGHLKG